MKLAYFGFPHRGGTFTVYRLLREGLAPLGTELVWIGAGEAAHKAWRDPDFAAEHAHGFVTGTPGDGEEAKARALVNALETGGFDGVIVSVLADRAQTNAVRYLAKPILRIMIVHNITPATYAAARAIRDHVHATVGVSPRIRDDLVRSYGFDDKHTLAIPNGTDLAEHLPAARPFAAHAPLRLLSLGRIEDVAKGVFWLPQILEMLPPEITLTIAGTGPDAERLRALCGPLGGRVHFTGEVGPDEVDDLMKTHDILLGPSRFEGFMITAVEAMARGCVPVVARIHGVTDAIVTDGADGLLFPVGDWRAAAAAVMCLNDDRPLLHRLAAAGCWTAHERFRADLMASRYHALIRRLVHDRPPIAKPLAFDHWRMARGLRPGLRSYLPLPIKNVLRVLRERAVS
ncbi:glycosyltransferase family 4 protein [Chelatococcus asaccharovorans]|uniref:glycosyltransferase family 4 protein n=1 Tax=Chelatococcus asaccharovorans TaxID=28210 RepID=UPI00224C6E74|nr:glycosyltransferase family 4 protein [Chelatococcus asaccharovorans]CAH1668116.1 Glycosyl transferase family 4 [Chelatococcus asaccharovorans]CAH1680374.1 Glycosyl transferase family 4 [Chelatococcus asaccharovorans]